MTPNNKPTNLHTEINSLCLTTVNASDKKETKEKYNSFGVLRHWNCKMRINFQPYNQQPTFKMHILYFYLFYSILLCILLIILYFIPFYIKMSAM